MQMVGFILLFGALPLHTVSWQFVLDTKWDILPLLDLWWELLMHFVTSTCTKMLNNTTKERQKPKKHNTTWIIIIRYDYDLSAKAIMTLSFYLIQYKSSRQVCEPGYKVVVSKSGLDTRWWTGVMYNMRRKLALVCKNCSTVPSTILKHIYSILKISLHVFVYVFNDINIYVSAVHICIFFTLCVHIHIKVVKCDFYTGSEEMYETLFNLCKEQ